MPKSIVSHVSNASAGILGPLQSLQRNAVDMLLNTAGLAIGTSANHKVKIVNTIYALIDGVLVKKTTAEVTLAGTVVNATFNVWVLSMTADGTVTATFGTAGATLGTVVLPTIPASSVVLGFVIVNPTGTGNFVGGTTPLDDATVVPNAVYINTSYPFNPNAIALGLSLS